MEALTEGSIVAASMGVPIPPTASITAMTFITVVALPRSHRRLISTDVLIRMPIRIAHMADGLT